MSKQTESQRVDDTLTAVSGEWSFDGEVADSFDEHVRKSVPFYDEIQRMTVELSEYFVREDSVIYDLGSSTGETLGRLVDFHQNKNSQFIGVEISEGMVNKARENISSERVRFFNRDVMDVSFSPQPDFVVSLFTLQFLPLENRRELLSKIYRSMNEGGAIVFTEKVHAEDSRFEDMWLELYWDFKRRQDLTPSQILQKAGSIRGVLKPLSIKENLNLLGQVGFEQSATFFQWYNWTGFIAVKNESFQTDSSSPEKVVSKQKFSSSDTSIEQSDD